MSGCGTSGSGATSSFAVSSTCMFVVSSTVWVLLGRRRRRRRLRHGTSSNDDDYDEYDDEAITASKERHNISSRGHLAAFRQPSVAHLEYFRVCLQNPCDLQFNPEGYIALCISENKLCLDVLAERFVVQTASAAAAAFSDSSVFAYNDFMGTPVARQAAAYFIARRFVFGNGMKRSHTNGNNSNSNANNDDEKNGEGDDEVLVQLTPEEALSVVEPRRVGLATGASALLSQLFFLLGEEGEACLIPAPYYSAFDRDAKLAAKIVPIPVEQSDPASGPTTAELERAYQQARENGLRVRFLLLTNPNNPLGVIYSPDTMLGCVQWARSKRLHTICDEIYALSTHKTHGHGFKSILRILDNKLGTDVHFLWAVSKDLGAGGLRAAVVYTHNEALLRGLAAHSVFTSISGPIQYLVADLLTDDAFVDYFLEESRRRIRRSYQICCRKLNEMVLPHQRAVAGVFCYADFSSLLPQKTARWEEEFCRLMFRHARVVLTPGGCGLRDVRRPGHFRICYAWVPPEILELAMERLSRFVAKIRRLHGCWEDLSDPYFAGVV